MAGHMGHVRVTTLNLKVITADPERNLLLIRGAVPGPKGGLLMVRSAIRALRRDNTKKAS
jgi:large subunit ribosomal protein L3